MKLRSAFTILSFLAIPLLAFSWGKTGHRIVNEIAWQHMTKKARKNVQAVLGDEQLPLVGNWMDFIRSERSYDSLKYWHYCTVPDGKTYTEAGTPEKGDAVYGINKLTEELRTKQFSVDEVFALKCLTHLVGDIHQPLHVGNGTDKGGNDAKVEFFWSKTNLHRVWDSGMIDHQQLSYTEYAMWINVAKKDQIDQWQSTTVLDWVNEAIAVRSQVYNYPENGKLSYRYVYDNVALMNNQLLKAGIRLAGILNVIYG